MSARKKIVVICPGRGSYTKDTLGYLKNASGLISDFIADIDQRRKTLGDPTISELDGAEKFKSSLHTKGEHASPLIYACSYFDFMSIDRDRYEIVAVTGNSMGWYLTLGFAGALNQAAAFDVIQTMGGMMRDKLIGGQVIYPVVDAEWHRDANKEQSVLEVLRVINECDGALCEISIDLGGYWVIGGNQKALRMLLDQLPKDGDYPFQLINHGAFHTPLLKEVSNQAFEHFNQDIFQAPQVPMIDGQGKVWDKYSSSQHGLYEYTFGHQVVKPYEFTKAVTVALKEFAPDHLVLLGPGGSLGGAIGQVMVQTGWRGVQSKAEFSALQKSEPFLLAMGNKEQRGSVLAF